MLFLFKKRVKEFFEKLVSLQMARHRSKSTVLERNRLFVNNTLPLFCQGLVFPDIRCLADDFRDKRRLNLRLVSSQSFDFPDKD